MPQPYIDITISEQGEIESEVQGILGPDCEGLTDFLDELGDVVEHRKTKDYYRAQRVASRARVGGKRR